MGGNLALVQSFVLLAGVLYPQRPVAEVARMLDQEPVVATVRRQADRQQLVVFPPEPGHLQKWGEREGEKKTVPHRWAHDQVLELSSISCHRRGEQREQGVR